MVVEVRAALSPIFPFHINRKLIIMKYKHCES